MKRAIARGLLLVALSSRAWAQQPTCTDLLTRRTLVPCALESSPLVAAELANVRAAAGRREAARPFLPSNPTLSGSLGSRVGSDGTRATNWSLTVGQELEIAGQSVLRVEVADDELAASKAQTLVVRAELAERLWLGWFEAIAAQERIQLASELERATGEVARTAAGMAANGLAPPVDAAAADAAFVAVSERRVEAQRLARRATLTLESLTGRRVDTTAATLEPLRLNAQPLRRPELTALEALESASSRRVEVLRRARAPNPTVTLFAQNDGFNERVLGVGLGLPIPLPQPIGKTKAGEIEEALAAEARTQAELDALTRRLDTERALAESDRLAAAERRALFPVERLEKARAALQSLSAQLAAGRVSVREALVTQQALVQLLQAELDAREAACLASVHAARANGLSLEGDL